MTIQLTPQQQADLDRADDALVRVVDPRTNAAYVLVPAGDFESVREALEDEGAARAARRAAPASIAGTVAVVAPGLVHTQGFTVHAIHSRRSSTPGSRSAPGHPRALDVR